MQAALRTGEVHSYLAKGSRSVTARGPAYYEAHAVPIDNGDGRRGLCIVAADVSEHLARSLALQESEEKLRIAVEAAGIGLWTWDIASDRVEWDERMIEIVGCAPVSVSEYVERLVHPLDRARMAAEASGAATGDASFPEHRIIRPDGEVRWLLPCGKIFRDDAGRVARMTGGTLDVTAQRLTGEHLRKAQKLDAIGSLTAGVTHNFNNMLAVIIPTLELALRGAASGQTQAAPPVEMLEDALHASRRATELVGQLMRFAGQRRAPAVKRHDLAPIVERAVSMCRRTFEPRVQIDVTTAPGCAAVACEPMAIEQVVVNLLINARDAVVEASRDAPRITVQLSETLAVPPDAQRAGPQRYASIRVEDNGVGMTEAVKQRLFEPFFTTKEAGKGTGLGLATSYGIARDHGGFIAIESQRGAGTTVTLFLPLAGGASASSRTAPPSAANTVRGTVLVVDDELAMRRVAQLLLVERGHRVHIAADGAAAVALLDTGVHPDVILLDRSMPGWSAQQTVEEIRKRVPSTPIVFFTGQDVTGEERACVQEVLYKPLAGDDLVAAVERWLLPRP
jgi:PAS domain S-box-containing protein